MIYEVYSKASTSTNYFHFFDWLQGCLKLVLSKITSYSNLHWILNISSWSLNHHELSWVGFSYHNYEITIINCVSIGISKSNILKLCIISDSYFIEPLVCASWIFYVTNQTFGIIVCSFRCCKHCHVQILIKIELLNDSVFQWTT